jgi:hypothetical protein
MLDQKKKKLEELRNFLREPLNTQEILEHQKKYEAMMEEKN